MRPPRSRPGQGWRARVTGAAVGLFSHAPDPLAGTFEHRGDPGLFGPGSATWAIMSDASAFVGGLRALVVQAAHPEVAAGVGDHSNYRQDPLGRLSRTAAYVTATSYGSMPEVEAAVAAVGAAHRPVVGTSHRGVAYTAVDPGLSAWVHNALVDSFLAAHRAFGPGGMDEADYDRYVAEQTRLGALLGASPLPETAADLRGWLVGHPAVGGSPAGLDAVAFLSRSGLPWPTRLAYTRLLRAAVATVPGRLREATLPGAGGGPADRLAVLGGRVVVGVLRSALGSSPAWGAALDRCGTPRPEGVRFRPVTGVAR